MSKTDNFDFWGLIDDDIFVGFMVVRVYKNIAYLFFLAIDASCRSKGYGGKAIEMLDDHAFKKREEIFICGMGSGNGIVPYYFEKYTPRQKYFALESLIDKMYQV